MALTYPRISAILVSMYVVGIATGAMTSTSRPDTSVDGTDVTSSSLSTATAKIKPQESNNILQYAGYNISSSPRFKTGECFVFTKDPFMSNRIDELVVMKTKLINYNFSFPSYDYNPLLVNSTWTYKANSWSRVSNQHGQTLLSLAFNYGVLSLMTLTFGVEKLDIELLDQPFGCMGRLNESAKMDTIILLIMRDFQLTNEVTFVEDERVCHEIISIEDGVAFFRDRCCKRSRINGKVSCGTDFSNIWLTILYVMLSAVRYGLLLFGPVLFIPAIESMARDNVPFSVKLKEPLFKTIFLCRGDDTPVNVQARHKLDFRKSKGFYKLKESSSNMPIGEPIRVKISEYDIDVCYKRLLTENIVPVGLMHSIFQNICHCKLRDLHPFHNCCKSNMLKTCQDREPVPWIWFWHKVGLLLMVLLLPTPMYFRILIFYFFEYDEVTERKKAVEDLGYLENYQNNLTHYLTPTHWIFVCIYILYFLTAVIVAYLARKTEEGRFRRIIIGAFRDLQNMSWVTVLDVMVTNLVWPFKRYGLAGCGVAIFYWPFAVPFSITVYVLYCIPSVYLTLRMLMYSKIALVDRVRRKTNKGGRYKVKKITDQSLKTFEAKNILSDEVSISSKSRRASSVQTEATLEAIKVCPPRRDMNWRRFAEHFLAAVLCVLTMYGILLMLSECVGCLVEMFVFTMMGIIVNAGAMLKYCTLIFLVILYSYDTFNNVPKKYLKLNKSLFNEVKGRIKDLDKVTSLPSYLQENRGFKAQEISEQADYESPDEISTKSTRHWMINDLVLFIDNEDMPRIPRKLFEDVCEIRVAGAPGPVYCSLMEAFQQFLMIVLFLLFVFIVILSFGAVYKVSSTNQMMATLAGGFLPFILKTFMAPAKPEIELGTVSFKSKCDEIIKNFYQYWPIFDFPFVRATPEDEMKEGEGDEDKDKDKKDKEADTDSDEANNNQPGPSMPVAATVPSAVPEDNAFTSTKADTALDGVDSSKPPAYNVASKMNSLGQLHPIPGSLPLSNPTIYSNENELKAPGSQPEETEGLLKADDNEPPPTPSKMAAFDILGQYFKPDDDVTEVDYLIYLPELYDEFWLDEWSDMDPFEEPNYPDVTSQPFKTEVDMNIEMKEYGDVPKDKPQTTATTTGNVTTEGGLNGGFREAQIV